MKDCNADETNTQYRDQHRQGDSCNEYLVKETGVYLLKPSGEEKRISSKIIVAAALRDQSSQSWSRFLKITDSDGFDHSWVMPMSQLAGEGNAIIEKLLDLGAMIEPGIKPKLELLRYLQRAPEIKGRCTKRFGWNESVFVFPDESIQAEGCEPIVHLPENTVAHRYCKSGSLEEWQSQVAMYCSGNSRLVFGLSTAFAAPLLELLNEESFGANLSGPSSKGKTTLLMVAGSVYGGGKQGYLWSWRATCNGLEAIAALHNCVLLVLDEMGQIDPRQVGEAAYMLAQGSGKARGSRSGNTIPPHAWRIIYLSSGEITLADHMDEAGKRAKAGQEIRLLDVPISDDETGSITELHGFASASALADHLREASQKFYGVAGRSFIKGIVDNRESIIPDIQALIQRFSEENSGPVSSSQISRVVKKFGLIAAAGELASELDVLPFEKGECFAAVSCCFQAWLRGWGTGEKEATGVIRQMQDFLNMHGESRFVEIDQKGNRTDKRESVANKVGYRQSSRDANGAVRIHFWWVSPAGFKEMIQGCNHRVATAMLIEKKIIVPGSDRNASQRRDPVEGENQRFYILNSALLGVGDELL